MRAAFEDTIASGALRSNVFVPADDSHVREHFAYPAQHAQRWQEPACTAAAMYSFQFGLAASSFHALEGSACADFEDTSASCASHSNALVSANDSHVTEHSAYPAQHAQRRPEPACAAAAI